MPSVPTFIARRIAPRAEVAAPGGRARRRRGALAALAVALLLAAIACAAVGGVSIRAASVVAMLAHALGLGVDAAPWTPQQAAVLFAIRLPRVALAALVGAGLGVSGAAMQGVFRNPLVDPGLLGVSSGAALGAVASIVVGARFAHGLPAWMAPYALSLAAFGGGLVAMVAVERVATVGGRTAVATLLLAGIAVNALAGALTGLCTYLADDAQLRTLTFWSLGSLGGATWRVVLGAAPFIVLPTLALPRLSRPLNAMLLGDAQAKHLGFDAERVKRGVMVAVALIVGASVAVSGVLGFVGLVVPHVVRLATGPDHRLVLPGSALLGAILLLLADAVSRTAVLPAELPLGVVTACLGTPFFLALLLKERRRLA